MAQYDIRPLQLRVLEILLAVDKACKAHGLRYYIVAGTLLGAVRHKGFIPWDDDLDIAMPRADYDKLIAHCKEYLPAQFEMICGENDAVYPLPFAKIQDAHTTIIERMHLRYLGGIYIDVFPLDGVPSNSLSRRWHFIKYEYYKRCLYLCCRDPYKHGHGPSSWVPLLVQKIYNHQELFRKMRKLQTEVDYDSSDMVVDHDDGLRGVMPHTVFGTPTPIMFEGKEVMGIEQADRYLSQKYGDYMTIPPHDDQRQHNFHYLDLQKPYREYAAEHKGECGPTGN